jgi:Flp pilus assembly protein TadD
MNLIEEGSQHFENGNFELSIEFFSKYIDSEGPNPNVLCLRGIAYRKVKDFNASIGDFLKAINLIPTNASVYSEIAVTQFHMKELKSALENMNKSQKLDPENPYRYSSRAYIKDACGDTEGAIADYKKCIELDPDDAIALNNLGMLEDKLGRKQKAENHFKRADQLSKDEKSPFFGKFNTEGEQVMNQAAAQKEVQNVINDAQIREEIEKDQKEEIKITETRKPTIGEVMMSVFKSKQEFKSFIQFIKNGFKS